MNGMTYGNLLNCWFLAIKKVNYQMVHQHWWTPGGPCWHQKHGVIDQQKNKNKMTDMAMGHYGTYGMNWYDTCTFDVPRF